MAEYPKKIVGESVLKRYTTGKVIQLPGVKSTDFVLKPCAIINVKSSLEMEAKDLIEDPKGTYLWETSSQKISISGANSANVIVTAKETPSASRGAEQITVTRTAPDGTKTSKVVNVTVAKVTFSASDKQKYGFDDYDTPKNTADDHINIKREDFTFVKVSIEGGALGSDFDFICDDPKICTADAAPAQAVFDLKLNAVSKVKSIVKADTPLHAKVKCPLGASFAKLQVHVYALRTVKVLVAKFYDSHSKGTTLKYPNADYASHQTKANAKLKEAVVEYKIKNMEGNKPIDVKLDAINAGVLTYDIAAGGGAGLEAIRAAMPEDKNVAIVRNIAAAGGAALQAIRAAMSEDKKVVNVAIVRNMKSYYYLSQAAKKDELVITLKGDDTYFVSGDTAPLGIGAQQEKVTIKSVTGNVIELVSPLTLDHPIGSGLEFPAAGWSSTPILIMEGEGSEELVKWTVLHEVGHNETLGLALSDIDDNKDFMHYIQDNTDNRLRFCPRKKHYHPDQTENQWETIPRPKEDEGK